MINEISEAYHMGYYHRPFEFIYQNERELILNGWELSMIEYWWEEFCEDV